MNKWVKWILITVGVLIVLALIATPIMNSIYQWQIEKARDTSRINDIKMIQSWLEQTYQDNAEYPSSLDDENLAIFLYKIPKDSKEWEIINWCTFWYTYEVLTLNKLENQWYILSTCLESKSNINKLTLDWGIYDNKFEVFTK